MAEPCFDVAHLGHVELLTDRFEESLDFFVNVYGLTESGREGVSAYLRGWDDYEIHTLKLTAADATGIGAQAPRAKRTGKRHGLTATWDTAGPTDSWIRTDMCSNLL